MRDLAPLEYWAERREGRDAMVWVVGESLTLEVFRGIGGGLSLILFRLCTNWMKGNGWIVFYVEPLTW